MKPLLLAIEPESVRVWPATTATILLVCVALAKLIVRLLLMAVEPRASKVAVEPLSVTVLAWLPRALSAEKPSTPPVTLMLPRKLLFALLNTRVPAPEFGDVARTRHRAADRQPLDDV